MLKRFRSLRACAAGLCAALVLALAASDAPASVPMLMNYQGYLTDASDQPVTNSLPMTFGIYADSTGGAPLWSESYASVLVLAGVFNVVLGTVTPLSQSLFTGAELWVQTTVDGTDLLPRRPIVTVAYAFRALTSDMAGTELWQTDGTHVYRLTGSVGIGTDTPAAVLDARGEATDYAGVVQGTQTSGSALGAGVLGKSEVTNGWGVLGIAHLTDGNGSQVPRGVVAITNAFNGVAVSAEANSVSGAPVAVFGVTNANGYAGYFRGGRNYFEGNVGIGDSSPDVPLSVAGDVHVTGTLTRAYTAGTSDLATPIAYGNIALAGTVTSATPNVSSSWDAVNNRYLITITGETYSTTSHVTTVTAAAGSATPRIATTSAVSGQLIVRVYDAAGNVVQNSFHFVTYKP